MKISDLSVADSDVTRAVAGFPRVAFAIPKEYTRRLRFFTAAFPSIKRSVDFPSFFFSSFLLYAFAPCALSPSV